MAINGKQWKQWQTLFSWAPKSLQMVTTTMKLKDVCSLEEKLPESGSFQMSQLFASRTESDMTEAT